MLCSFWKIKKFSIWEGSICDYTGEEPTEKKTKNNEVQAFPKHFLQELPVNEKIVTDFFVVSDIDF